MVELSYSRPAAGRDPHPSPPAGSPAAGGGPPRFPRSRLLPTTALGDAGDGRPDGGASDSGGDPGGARAGRGVIRGRWVTRVAVVAGCSAAATVAVLALVVARWPDPGGGEGPAAAFDAAVARSIEADLVLSSATWVEYVAVLLLLGGAAFRLFVSRPPFAGRGRPERVLLAAAVAGVVACLGTVPLRAVVVSGRGAAAVLDPDVTALVLTSRFGDAACLRLVALVLFGLTLSRPPRGWERRLRIIRPGATMLVFGSISARTVERAVCITAGLAALASFSMVGHPQASEPRPVLVAAQAAHVLAAAVWFGGGAVLALEIGRQRRWGSPRCTAEAVARFSTVAGVALGLAAVTGAVLARSQLASPGALVSTAYGRALVVKLLLVAGVAALGAYNHHRVVPAVVAEDDPAGWRLLGRTAAVEAVLMAVGVLVATAALTSGGF